VDEERDRTIADHVLRMHRYLPPGVEEGTPCHDNLSQPLSIEGPDTATNDEAVDTSPFEKYDPLLHMGVRHRPGRQTRSSKPKKSEILSIAFVKKYIQYAKSKTAPVLTKGAADYIVEVYANLRNEGMEGNKKKTSPLTARTLETLIRLATAHAKARLSPKVERANARQAEEIMRFALFREVPKRQRRKKRKLNNGIAVRKGSDGSDDDDSEESEDEAPSAERITSPVAPTSRSTAAPVPPPEDPIWGDESQDIPMTVDDQPVTTSAKNSHVRSDRIQLFRSRVSKIFVTRMQDEETIFLTDLVEFVNEGLSAEDLFGTTEATEICEIMGESDELMISEGIVYKV